MEEFNVGHIKQLKHLCDLLHKQEITLEGFLHSQKELLEAVQHANKEIWQDYCLELYDLEILVAAKIGVHFDEHDHSFVRKIASKLSNLLPAE
jgi:hypothetical protein